MNIGMNQLFTHSFRMLKSMKCSADSGRKLDQEGIIILVHWRAKTKIVFFFVLLSLIIRKLKEYASLASMN